jgi:hypothetical protein
VRLELFKAIDWFMDDPLEIVDVVYDNIQKMEKQGIAFSVFDDVGCIGCGGYIMWEENVAEAWIRLDKRALGHSVKGIRIIQEGFRVLANVYHGKVFCWVDETWPVAQRMVKWFGFVKQGNECRVINEKEYGYWELNDGNNIDDSRVGCVSHGADATSQHDATAGRSPSTDIRI